MKGKRRTAAQKRGDLTRGKSLKKFHAKRKAGAGTTSTVHKVSFKSLEERVLAVFLKRFGIEDTTTDRFIGGRSDISEVERRSKWKFLGHLEIVGGYYHSMFDARVDGLMQIGARVDLTREPDNRFDPNAIAVHCGGYLVGFVQKDEAQRLGPLMDLGIKLGGRVLTHIERPMRCTIRLYATGAKKDK